MNSWLTTPGNPSEGPGAPPPMKHRFDAKIIAMKSQVMSFDNDGMKFNLNVPDTHEVKEMLAAVTTTLVQQQQQISMLNETIKKMADNNYKTQQDFIKWNNESIQELLNKNSNLEMRLKTTSNQLRNFEYNMQGFADNNISIDFKSKIYNVQPPKLLKTIVPSISQDTDILDARNPPIIYPEEANIDANDKTSIAINDNMEEQILKKEEKLLKRRQESLKLFNSIGENKCPIEPKARWIWAFKKVRLVNWFNSNKVGYSNRRVTNESTLAKRLKRMEDLLFKIPIELQLDIDTKTASIINNSNKEFERVDNNIITNNNETIINFEAVRVDINTNSEKIKIIEEKAVSSGGELENKVEILTERVSFTESIHNASIKKRIDGLLLETRLLSKECDQIIYELKNIKEIPLIGEENKDDNAKIEHNIDKLKSKFSNIDSYNYTIMKLYERLKGDIAYIYNDLEKDNKKLPLITQFEKDELFAKCDELDKELQKIELFKDNNLLWVQSKEFIISKWNNFTNVIQSVTKVDEFTKQLDILLQEKEKITVVQDNFSELKLDLSAINTKIIAINSEIEEVKKNSFEDIDVSAYDNKRPRSSIISARGHSASVVKEPFANMELALQPVMRDILDLNSKVGTATSFDINQQTEHLIRDIMQMYINLATLQQGGKYKSRPNSSKISSRKPSLSEVHINIYLDEFECIGRIDNEGQIIIDTSNPKPSQMEGALVSISHGEYKGRKGVVHLDQIKNISPKNDDIKHSARFNIDPINNENEGQQESNNSLRYKEVDAENNPIHVHLFEDIKENNTIFDDVFEEERLLNIETLKPPEFTGIEYKNVPSNAEIELLREEIKRVGFSVDTINRNKIDIDKAHLLLSNKADNSTLEHKVDIDMMAIVEKNLNKVIFDLNNNTQSQLKNISELKNQMREAMSRAINKAMLDADEEKTTMLATKQLCFGCGRPSYVKSTPSGNDNSGFVPHLNSIVTPGCDIIRGGFRMPVRINSPIPTSKARQKIDVQFEDSVDGQSLDQSLDQSSEVYPEVDGHNNDNYMNYNNSSINSIQIYVPNEQYSDGNRKISIPAKAVRRAQGNEDGTLLRPILRKGFPGKKSMRAEAVYAPERFDLGYDVSPNISVMSSSIPINPRNIRTADGNRPRMGQSSLF